MDFILLTVGDTIDKAFYGFDIAIFKFFAAIECSFLTGLAKFFTTFGDENFMIPMVIVGIVLMLFKKTRKYGFAIVFSIIVGTLLTNVIFKPMFLRIRPYNTLQGVDFYQAAYFAVGGLSESDYSFPSGHTTGAFEAGMVCRSVHLRMSLLGQIQWKRQDISGWSILSKGSSGLYTTFKCLMLVLRSFFLITFAKGSLMVLKMSVTVKAVASSL